MTTIRFYFMGIWTGLMIALCLFFLFRWTKTPAVTPDSTPIQGALQAQHRADSVQALLAVWQQQRRIDSLTLLLLHRHVLDSMRAHARLSDLDVLRKINGAIPKR
ncbi:hypothetical protein ACS5NO_12845 [Larkinella sp. GY13]|uniref:hypothetical protein n=1 Tax=Larkinella sp. GY13 TaxID=3453720 RepID=UPI003EEDFEEF